MCNKHERLAEQLRTALTTGAHSADMYADRITTWHNTDFDTRDLGSPDAYVSSKRAEWERLCRAMPDYRRTADIHRGDAVLVATTLMTGTTPSGTRVNMPTCVIYHLVDGRIAHLEEYLDSASTRPLREALAELDAD